MSIQPLTFDLTDSQGQSHSYTCSAHSAIEGQEIMFQLLAAGIGALGPVITSIASSGGKISEILDKDTSHIFSQIDVSAATRELSSFLMRPETAELVKSIFQFTYRDSMHLYNEGNYGLAYQANYGELLQAIWKVVNYNGFLPLPGISLGSTNQS